MTLKGLAELKPRQWLEAEIVFADGETRAVPLLARIDTLDELDYFRNGGILHYVLRGAGARRGLDPHCYRRSTTSPAQPSC